MIESNKTACSAGTGKHACSLWPRMRSRRPSACHHTSTCRVAIKEPESPYNRGHRIVNFNNRLSQRNAVRRQPHGAAASAPCPSAAAAAQHASWTVRRRHLINGSILGIWLSMLEQSHTASGEPLLEQAECSAADYAAPGTCNPHSRQPDSGAAASVQRDYDTYASTYDKLDDGVVSDALGFSELRQRLLGAASGTVLEVAVGTGLNLPSYDWNKVQKLVAVDISNGMLQQAKARVAAGQLAGRPITLQQVSPGRVTVRGT